MTPEERTAECIDALHPLITGESGPVWKLAKKLLIKIFQEAEDAAYERAAKLVENIHLNDLDYQPDDDSFSALAREIRKLKTKRELTQEEDDLFNKAFRASFRKVD